MVVTLSYSGSAPAALDGSDFTKVATISIPASGPGGLDPEASANLFILNDVNDEENEFVTVAISGGLPAGVVKGSPSSQTVTIQDDDLPRFVTLPVEASNCGVSGFSNHGNVATSDGLYSSATLAGSSLCKSFEDVAAVDASSVNGRVNVVRAQVEQKVSAYLDDEYLVQARIGGILVHQQTVAGSASDTTQSVVLAPTRDWTVADLADLQVTVLTLSGADGTADGAWHVDRIFLEAEINRGPATTAGSESMNEDTILTGALTGSDPDGNTLSYAVVTPPSKGSVNLNAGRGTFTYQPNLNQVGADEFTFHVSDGQLAATETFSLTLNAQNDVPGITTPSGSQPTQEDTPKTFGTPTGNPIVIVDVDADPSPIRVTLTATNGKATLASTEGLDFACAACAGDGTSDGIMTYQATVADANAALDGVSFAPNPNFAGTGTLKVDANDLGASGAGGAKSASKTVSIPVSQVNDSPTISEIPPQSTPEGTATSAIAFTVDDVETASDDLVVTASSSNTALVPDSNIALGGSGSTRTIAATPIGDEVGTTTITITASDPSLTGVRTFVLTVTNVNDAPTVSAVADVTISEDSSTAPIPFTVGDVDPGDVLVVTVTSTNPNLVPAESIVVTGDGSTRTMVITPPANRAGAATILINATDAIGESFEEAFILTVTAVNDAPVNLVPSGQTTNEDIPLTFSSSNGNVLAINDVDSGSSPMAIHLTATGGVVTLGSLAGLTLTAGDGVGDGSLSFSASLSNANFAFDGLFFTPTQDFHGAASLSISTSDQGATGTGGARGDFDTVAITVLPLNDAPSLDTTLGFSVAGASEDAATTPSTTVGEMLASGGADAVFDPDAGALEGIAIVAVTGEGRWQYLLQGGAWLDVGTVAASESLLLRPTDALRYEPDGGNGETATVSFRAWDQTSGEAGTRIATAPNGGTSPFSAEAASATLLVSPVNDAPVLDPAAPYALASLSEDDPPGPGATIASVLDAEGIDGVTDVDEGAHEGIAVTAATGPGIWQFSLDGSDWATVGAVSPASALLLAPDALIRYDPNGGEPTSPTALTFRAWDQSVGDAGNTADASAGGGTSAFSSASATIGIDVTAVNDAPVLDATVNHAIATITEDDVDNAGTTVSDVLEPESIEDSDADALEGIAVTAATVNGNGEWQYSLDGTAWNPIGTVSSSVSLLLRADDVLRFQPDGLDGASGTLTFRAWDQTAGAAGSKVDTSSTGGTSAFSQATDVLEVTVTALTEPPTFTDLDVSPSILEEGQHLQTVAATDEETPDEITFSIPQTQQPANGAATIDATTGELAYAPDVNFTGTDVFSVKACDVDGGCVSAQITVEVQNVNDPPAFTTIVRSPTTPEETLHSQLIATTDPDPASTVQLAIKPGFEASHGVASIDGGQLTYLPEMDYVGQDSVIIVACDELNACRDAAITLTITNVNDAPLLSPGDATTGEISEDDTTGMRFDVGAFTGMLEAAGHASDIDDDPLGLAIVQTGATAGGAWRYSPDASIWATIGTVNDNNAFLVGEGWHIAFFPDGTTGGSATVTYRLWDASDGAASGERAPAPAGGAASPFSAATRSISLTIVDVNDAPTMTSVPAQVVTAGVRSTAWPVHVADDNSPSTALMLTGSSSNTALIRNSDITLGGTGATRTVSVKALAGTTGTVGITLGLADPDGGESVQSFWVTVTPQSPPPAPPAPSPPPSPPPAAPAPPSPPPAPPAPPTPPPADPDNDGRLGSADNCPNVPNPGQEDADGDGLGDSCDADDMDGPTGDKDSDGKANASDNCLAAANADQSDADGDGVGDACDLAPHDGPLGDLDGDGVSNGLDNCPTVSNPTQPDADGDGKGDACDLVVNSAPLGPSAVPSGVRAKLAADGALRVTWRISDLQGVAGFAVWRDAQPLAIVEAALATTSYTFTDSEYAGGLPTYVVETLGALEWGDQPDDALATPAARGLQIAHCNGADTDGDGLCDLQEAALGTDSLHADSDRDGYSDELEIAAGADPLVASSYPLGKPDSAGDTGFSWKIALLAVGGIVVAAVATAGIVLQRRRGAAPDGSTS